MTILTKQEISAIAASLSGMAAKILFVFLLAAQGQSFTGQELAAMLGKSENTISTAATQLETLGYLQNNGRRYGWSLLPKIYQLSLGFPAENKTAGELGIVQKNLDSPKIFGLEPLSSSSSKSLGKESLATTNHQEGEDSPNFFGLSPESRPENTVPVGPENTVPDDPEDTEVAHWLIHGGIAPASPKMTAILALQLPAAYVQAHVLEHLWEVQEWERTPPADRGRRPGTGSLIYRLENDWSAPAMRCPVCLLLLAKCLCGLVKR